MIDTAVEPTAPPLIETCEPVPVPVTVLLMLAVPEVAVTDMMLPERAAPVVTLVAPVRLIVPVVPVVIFPLEPRVMAAPEFNVTLVVEAPPRAALT